MLQMMRINFSSITYRAIVRKQNLRQFDLEKAEEALSVKSKQRDELQKSVDVCITSEGLVINPWRDFSYELRALMSAYPYTVDLVCSNLMLLLINTQCWLSVK